MAPMARTVFSWRSSTLSWVWCYIISSVQSKGKVSKIEARNLEINTRTNENIIFFKVRQCYLKLPQNQSKATACQSWHVVPTHFSSHLLPAFATMKHTKQRMNTNLQFCKQFLCVIWVNGPRKYRVFINHAAHLLTLLVRRVWRNVECFWQIVGNLRINAQLHGSSAYDTMRTHHNMFWF